MEIKKFLSVAISMFMIGTLFAGCGGNSGNDGATAGGNGGYKFTFLTNTQNNSFQSTMNDTFKKLCEEKGYSYVCLDPDYDVNKQLGQADAANQKYDAVFVIPVDSQGIRQGLEDFKSAGIPVINVDTAVVKEDRELIETVIATDCVMAGLSESRW